MGGIKLSTDQISSMVKERGGIYLGETVVKHRRIIQIRCHKGHEWKVLLNNFKDGDWCLECSKEHNKINREDVLKIVKEKGYELLTSGEINRTTKIMLYCKKHDFRWISCYGNLRYNNDECNCRLCARNFVTIDTIKDFVAAKNGMYVGRLDSCTNTHKRLLVRCNAHNYVFRTRWRDLINGIWCSKCAPNKKIIKHDKIRELVETRNGTLLSSDCVGATTLFNIRCNKDKYEWETSWSRIKSGCWCPRCSGMEKYTLDSVRKFVKNKGGELLDDHIDNVKQRVSIRCACGNIFSSSLSHIVSHGLWCQLCNLAHCSQRDVFKIIKLLFPNEEIQYDSRPFDWLKTNNTKKARLQLDIWVPNIKLAIEYDGKQHFEPVRFAAKMTEENAKESLKQIRRRDRKKNKLIASHPNEIKYFIRLNYKDKITKELIISRLLAHSVPIPQPQLSTESPPQCPTTDIPTPTSEATESSSGSLSRTSLPSN